MIADLSSTGNRPFTVLQSQTTSYAGCLAGGNTRHPGESRGYLPLKSGNPSVDHRPRWHLQGGNAGRVQSVSATLYPLTRIWSASNGLPDMVKYTAAQEVEISDRWQPGEQLTAIGRLFDRPSSSICNMLAPAGGIRQSPRLRSSHPGASARCAAQGMPTGKGMGRDRSQRQYPCVSVRLLLKIVLCPAHREGDLIFGTNNSQIATL